MPVLGICDGHDAGACLVREGRVLAAVSEERLTGRKRQPGFPRNAVRVCMDLAGASPSDISCVAAAERAGRSIHRLLDRMYRRTDPNLPMHRRWNLVSMAAQNFIARSSIASEIDSKPARAALSRRLSSMGIHAPLKLVDHHRAHAVSAAVGSGFERALVVTIDAFGDGLSAAVSKLEGGRLIELDRVPYPHSPALVYGLTTSYLGYAEGDEGKVAGLAALGDPSKTAERFDRFIEYRDGAFRMKRSPTMTRLKTAFGGFDQADVAAGLQHAIERIARRYVVHWTDRVQAPNLCLAGGLFANVRLNQKVAEASGCDDLYVFPHMGDGGLCVGAAWDADGALDKNREMFSPFVGPTPGAVRLDHSRARPLDDEAYRRMTRRLSTGEVVAVVAGRMEFGPRALGRRSLLFRADDAGLAESVGQRLKRPGVMPFAPVARRRDVQKITDGPAYRALSHMTVTVDAGTDIAKRYPTAAHADGSMRLQAVDESDEIVYRILCEYGKHIDPPMLINTSFNMHTEPITAYADKAIELFERLALGGLVLEDRYLERP